LHQALQTIDDVQMWTNGSVQFCHSRLPARSVHPRFILAVDATYRVLQRTTEAGMAMRLDHRDTDETLGLVGGFGDVDGCRMLKMRWADLHPVLFVEGDDIRPDRVGRLQHPSVLQVPARGQGHER
jgi:hypothetical protein